MFGRVERQDRYETIRGLFEEVSKRNLRNQLAELEIMESQAEQQRRTRMLEQWRAGLTGAKTQIDVLSLQPQALDIATEFGADVGRVASRQLEQTYEALTPPGEREIPAGVESELARRMNDEALASHIRTRYGVTVDPTQLQKQREETPRDITRMTPYQMLVTGQIDDAMFDRIMTAGKSTARQEQDKYILDDTGTLQWNLGVDDAINESISVENQLVKIRDNIEARIRRRVGNRAFERMEPEDLEGMVREEIQSDYASLYDNLAVKANALNVFIKEMIPPPRRPESELFQALGETADKRNYFTKIFDKLFSRNKTRAESDVEPETSDNLNLPSGGF
jgi:hypothetical protein